ncbi:MAG: hypothetical protein WCK77_09310 [Verrucomicrobiota bacterium]
MAVRSGPRRAADNERPWAAAGLTSAERARRFAVKAASLTSMEWPAFFRAQLRSPEWTPLAARMWAEADPAGFWSWLRSQADTSLLMEWGPDLLGVWTLAEPDAAMAVALKLTNKEFADVLRRRIVDAALATDLTTGLRLAALAGDFNRFGWGGSRDWIEKDPQAAVLGLEALPRYADYRLFLSSAVVVWAKADARAALAWLSTQHHEGELSMFGSFENGFKAAAETDPQAALVAAKALPDIGDRYAAIGAVLTSGKVPPQEVADWLESASLSARAEAVPDAIKALARAADPAALATATELLDRAPANKQTLYATNAVAYAWGQRDWQAGWDWAAALPDAAMRRAALAKLVGSDKAPRDELAAMLAVLPPLALSNDLFVVALARLPADRREAWLASLPPPLAAWAKAANR